MKNRTNGNILIYQLLFSLIITSDFRFLYEKWKLVLQYNGSYIHIECLNACLKGQSTKINKSNFTIYWIKHLDNDIIINNSIVGITISAVTEF